MIKSLLTCSLAIAGSLSLQAAPLPQADRAYFFATCSSLNDFGQTGDGKAILGRARALSVADKQAINGLFDTWEKTPGDNFEELAFILATARRESDGTWQPIREAPSCGLDEQCRERAIGRMLAARAKPGHAPRANYAAPAANGQRYYGRGYIQLTYLEGYKKVDEKLRGGHRLVDHPDDVMQIDIAQRVLVEGMLEGWFGDHKPLSTWLGHEPFDWLNARNNVNPGSPHKPITAASAQQINKCLRARRPPDA